MRHNSVTESEFSKCNKGFEIYFDIKPNASERIFDKTHNSTFDNDYMSCKKNL